MIKFSNFLSQELAYRKEMVRADFINKKVGIRYALKLISGGREENSSIKYTASYFS